MEKFHSYTIKPVGKLGEGAFGYVEKIELYNSMGDLCGIYARKILNPSEDILKSISKEEIKKIFIREAICQSKCVHDNVISIYLFNKNIETPWFIMEFGACDLESEINKQSLTETEKVNIIKMMLYGVKKIHGKDYLHRDIKPSNIIKFKDDKYKISDFGLVKNISSNSNLTAIGTVMGSGKYRAPEILYDAEYSQQTDIFALGMVFEELSIKDTSFKEVINKCKNVDKKARYNNITEVLSDVNKISLYSDI